MAFQKIGPVAGEDSPYRVWLRGRILYPLRRAWRRHIPSLIWYDSEVDVTVTLTENRLPHIASENMEASANDAISAFKSGAFYEIERKFSELGINFDTGMGFNGRDWEWDFSLSGPIRVKFRGRAKKPQQRY